jgi:hypothetical protein
MIIWLNIVNSSLSVVCYHTLRSSVWFLKSVKQNTIHLRVSHGRKGNGEERKELVHAVLFIKTACPRFNTQTSKKPLISHELRKSKDLKKAAAVNRIKFKRDSSRRIQINPKHSRLDSTEVYQPIHHKDVCNA